MSDLRYKVLSVLAGQSPGYYVYPNASAFIAEGLDPEEVETELISLLGEGHIEQETINHVVRTGREIYLERLEQVQSEIDNAPTNKHKTEAQKKFEVIVQEGEPLHETILMGGGFIIANKGRELLAAGEPDSRPKKVKQPKKKV